MQKLLLTKQPWRILLARLIVVMAVCVGCSEQTEVPPNRPQEPTRPYPYVEEFVRYTNPRAGVTLAGTFTYPNGVGPFPTVLLILGSGRLTRDCEVANHKIFLVLADYLTKRGLGVLRVDKRGLGESTGDYAAATSNELADDMLAGVEYLMTRSEVDKQRIGLIGLSEGGVLGPAVANATKDVAFVVALGGPALRGELVFAQQFADIGRLNGYSETEIEQATTFVKQFHVFVRRGDNREQLTQRFEELSQQLPLSDRVRARLREGIEVATSPWYRFFIDYDPALALAKLQTPVLFFIGEKDMQVAVANLPVAEQALRASGNTDATVTTLPRINHTLQTSDTGNPAEYGMTEETIAPAALALIGNWIAQRVD